MGFLAFFKFGLIFLDALAWPLFALAYPLFASVHAIETNSGSDMEKLVTYWTIFSLISLFEHAFMGMLQWVPFWPYMKLTLTCWMVIPHFDGAFYVYNHFVHPCLNVHMQSISNWFNKFQGFFFKHNFLDKDVKGLEKPVATENDMKVVQVTEKKEVGPVNLIPEIEPNAAKMEVPEMSNIPSDKQQVQKEWTCAMCQVTTTSETTLNSHLRGRRHRDTWEELMTAKNPKARRSKSNPLKEEPNNSAGNQVKVGKKPRFRCTICNIYCGRPEDLDCHLWGKKHLARIQELHSLARGEPA
ncbi:hypothetical protein HRI_001541300 [Hibiscus trionum]|uniref:HVA22-like protein n=1 Tax=Hibiscus trionum TaxID=183268 RepID=A0A9W7HJX1_HIBTR|nr:hypothetical protein HRI_001541300 [Hibiscus trionum]